jgi:uncharacterized protein
MTDRAATAERALPARTLTPGHAEGPALVLDGPVSFWGGVDSESGRVIDGRHPQFGEALSGRVVLLPAGRGSSSSSSVVAEMVRARTAPAGIVFLESDAILVLGAVVAAELYGRSLPMVQLEEQDYRSIRTGDHLSVEASDADAVVRIRAALNR